MNTEQQRFNKMFKFISRNLRLILVCALIGATAGLFWYLKTPKVYQATALITYQQQTNPSRLSPDHQTKLQDLVNNVGQQVTSRSSLEEIINSLDLYPDLLQRLPVEDVVLEMRQQILIEPRRGTDIFEVSFISDDPRLSSRVANSLAAKFIEENIRFREQRVSDTSAYVKDELAMAKAAMDKQEEGMRDYKLRHYNELPEQRPANIARLNALLTRDQNIQNNLQDLKRTQLLVQEQINLRRNTLARISEGQEEAVISGQSSPELVRVQHELDLLRNRYTDNHPDVRRTQSRLEALAEAHRTVTIPPGQSVADTIARDKQLAQLELQQREIGIGIDRLNQDQAAVRALMAQLQAWVEAAPVREAEWTSLTRDYSQLQQHYQRLVSRNLEAESVELLERNQRGSQFRIVETALPPTKPFRPDFARIKLMAVALGLGLGLFLAYSLEFLDTSFRSTSDLEEYLGLPVSCALPLLQTAGEKRMEMLRNIAWLTFLTAGFAALIGGVIMLWLRGIIVL